MEILSLIWNISLVVFLAIVVVFVVDSTVRILSDKVFNVLRIGMYSVLFIIGSDSIILLILKISKL